MSLSSVQDLMRRYFEVMGQGGDFSQFFDPGMTWRMVDSGQQVRGPIAVRDYLNELHAKMTSGEQGELVIADGHAYLEGWSVNAGDEYGAGLVYCIVYDVDDGVISAARCYGTLSDLMPEGLTHADKTVSPAG